MDASGSDLQRISCVGNSFESQPCGSRNQNASQSAPLVMFSADFSGVFPHRFCRDFGGVWRLKFRLQICSGVKHPGIHQRLSNRVFKAVYFLTLPSNIIHATWRVFAELRSSPAVGNHSPNCGQSCKLFLDFPAYVSCLTKSPATPEVLPSGEVP